jgi:hypothetical protein
LAQAVNFSQSCSNEQFFVCKIGGIDLKTKKGYFGAKTDGTKWVGLILIKAILRRLKTKLSRNMLRSVKFIVLISKKKLTLTQGD